MNRYWKRVGRVQIQGSDGKMYSYGGSGDGGGLDFKFSGEKTGDIYTDFTVSILGLDMATVNELTVWNPATAVSTSRRIEVYAGYEGGGLNSPIFEGIVMEAMPTNPPEMWVNFKCLRFGGMSSRPSAEKAETITAPAGKMLEDLAGRLGCKSRWDADESLSEKEVSLQIDSSADKAIRSFADKLGISCYEDHGVIVACRRHPQLGDPSNPIDIDTEHGMLALGNVTLAGATIKTRLDDRCGLMSWVRLKSTLVPKANGEYVVIRKKHTGHFRGDEWFTELETIRKGAVA